MSIGSETDSGASQILVSDLTIDGADNGIRIKSNSSRGGLVENVVYEDVCIRDTKNPIFMDSNYSFYGKERNKLPTFRDITLRDVHISGGGKITLDGYDAKHRLEMNFDNVTISGAAANNHRRSRRFEIWAGNCEPPSEGRGRYSDGQFCFGSGGELVRGQVRAYAQ